MGNIQEINDILKENVHLVVYMGLLLAALGVYGQYRADMNLEMRVYLFAILNFILTFFVGYILFRKIQKLQDSVNISNKEQCE